METRLSLSFKDTKHGQPPIIISYCHSMPAPHPLIESLLAHAGFANTITLEDVALQHGIRVDGRPITSATYYDWEEMCEQYLGVVLPKGEAIVSSTIKLKWLQDDMPLLPLEAHFKAYILRIIGGVLMPDKTRNWVHLMYLTVLVDLERVRRYS
ncbi:Serine/threonine-protein phosphatase 7 long form [Glycine max]|nr:Serine/threonine-protein phosphatase 7 long form [Glycine max]